MKQHKLIFYFFILAAGLSCDKDKTLGFCPKTQQYHFFTPEELSNIWTNQDSAFAFQNKISGQKNYGQAYVENDTIFF